MTLQVAGTSLQLLGVAITGLGLLYAWNRATRRFDQWRESITSTLVKLRQLLPGRAEATSAAVVIEVQSQASGAVRHPGETDERLSRVENMLSRLPGETKKTIDAAINEKLAEFDATGKGFALKDISWALGGIVVQVAGYVVSLYDQLVR